MNISRTDEQETDEQNQRNDAFTILENEPLLGRTETPVSVPGVRHAAMGSATAARNELFGLVIMALSALGFSIMSVLVKMAGRTFPSTEVVFARSMFQLIAGVIGCAIVKVAPWGPPTVNRWLLIGRGMAGAMGLGFYFFTIINMPLGDGTTLFFIGPAFTAVAAYLFLNEPYTIIDAGASVCCLVGVVLVSRPEFLFGKLPHDTTPNSGQYVYSRYIPSLSALAAAVSLAVAYCLVRVVGKSVHYLVHVTYFGLLSTILSGVLLFFVERPVPVYLWTIEEWTIMLGVGVSAFAAQCFLNAVSKGILSSLFRQANLLIFN
ncbi:hypothetical protein RTP6_005684 [Batrachochytrium dendrobatidis]